MSNFSRLHSRAAAALVAVAFSSASCSPSVSRTGYAPSSAVDEQRCRVAVKRGATFAPEEVDVLGQVEFGDSGFSTDCEEKTVIALMRKEACSAGADVADIVEEHRQDIASTCYRAKARLLRLRSRVTPALDDPRFEQTSVDSRSQLESSRTSSLLWGAVIAGAVAGLVTGVVLATKH
jgi:hypothetical protein